MSNKINYNYYDTRKFPQNKSTRKKKHFSKINNTTPFYSNYNKRRTISQNNDYYKRDNREMHIYSYRNHNYYNKSFQNSEEKRDYHSKNNNISLNKTTRDFISRNAIPDEDSIILETQENDEKEKAEENTNTKVYTCEYLLKFEKLEISMDINFLTKEVLDHINEIEKVLKIKNKNISMTFSNYSSCHTSKNNSSSNIIPLEKWAKKDYSNEYKAAEENKKKFEESSNVDTTKKQLRELLNILTKDNYENIEKQILEIIREDIEAQDKFLEVFFPKACMEKAYVELHAKLFYDLNKELPQKDKSKEKKKKTFSTLFMTNLINKSKQILKGRNYDDYITEKDPKERENKLKKFVLGNANFLTELIKYRILSKKIVPQCVNYLFEKYENEKEKIMKQIHIQSILVFIDKLGTLIQNEEKDLNSKKAKIKEDNKILKDNIEETFKRLEIIKNDQELSGHVKYSIINLIEKKNNNYEKSKFEKYIIAKSKKEVEEEFNSKDKEAKKEEEKDDEITQDYINERIKSDLFEYKDFIENEGNSEKFPWDEITILYDVKKKNLYNILEGYMVSCGDFIEKKNNIKYAKDYIKELIEYYNQKLEEEEKINLKKKLLDLFDLVKDFAFETPKIYELYSYVIYIFLENKIMEIEDLENLIKRDEEIKDNLNIINNIYKYY